MALLHQFLTVEQLQKLDPQQFEILKNALTHTIRTNQAIQDALRREVRAAYDQLTQATPPPSAAPPPPTTQRRRRTK
jgi:hypothetical protein